MFKMHQKRLAAGLCRGTRDGRRERGGIGGYCLQLLGVS